MPREIMLIYFIARRKVTEESDNYSRGNCMSHQCVCVGLMLTEERNKTKVKPDIRIVVQERKVKSDLSCHCVCHFIALHILIVEFELT